MFQTLIKDRGLASMVVALLVLNAVGFFVLYAKTEMDSNRASQEVSNLSEQIIKEDSDEDSMIQPEAVMATKAGQKEFNGWDLKFSYPDDWYVVTYEDEFAGGQTNVRITSQPGRLFLQGGGPATRKTDEFAIGAELAIREMDTRQDVVYGRKLQLLPTAGKDVAVSKIVGECDGAGCPPAEYVITVGSKRYYAFAYVVGDYEPDFAVVEAIVTSLRK